MSVSSVSSLKEKMELPVDKTRPFAPEFFSNGGGLPEYELFSFHTPVAKTNTTQNFFQFQFSCKEI